LAAPELGGQRAGERQACAWSARGSGAVDVALLWRLGPTVRGEAGRGGGEVRGGGGGKASEQCRPLIHGCSPHAGARGRHECWQHVASRDWPIGPYHRLLEVDRYGGVRLLQRGYSETRLRRHTQRSVRDETLDQIPKPTRSRASMAASQDGRSRSCASEMMIARRTTSSMNRRGVKERFDTSDISGVFCGRA
jgi:hypothetical protein